MYRSIICFSTPQSFIQPLQSVHRTSLSTDQYINSNAPSGASVPLGINYPVCKTTDSESPSPKCLATERGGAGGEGEGRKREREGQSFQQTYQWNINHITSKERELAHYLRLCPGTTNTLLQPLYPPLINLHSLAFPLLTGPF